ncbi:MAG: molybdenum cofactor guanylyltransferase [Acidobacteria bacterium]|nr:molybdenum cofactor guanylyltransferase [Acidobacteriota bacterium]
MDIEAFILIGGRSTRFGSDKAFFEFEGQTLAVRAATTVEAAFPQLKTVFIAADEDQFRVEVPVLGRPVVFDVNSGAGAWSGLHAALVHSKSEWTLVLACDLPYVTAKFLCGLADEAQDDVDAVVPQQHDGRLQPLCAIYRTKPILELVEERLAASDALPAIAKALQATRLRVIEPKEDDLLRNINSPDDLSQVSHSDSGG